MVGSPLPATIIGGTDTDAPKDRPRVMQAMLRERSQAQANVLGPRQKALEEYNETLDRLHLDGYVYPATQMPPPDETMNRTGRSAGARTALPDG